MSFLATGLGQVYNNQFPKALRLWGVQFAFVVLGRLAQLPTRFWGLVVIGIGVASVWGYSIGDAVRTARATPARALKSPRRYVLMGAVVIVALVLVQPSIRSAAFGVRAFRMPSAGMTPSLRVNDYFMVKLLAADAHVDRGDILVFHFPPEPRVTYVKRVVGFPGEEIELRGGQLMVGGRVEVAAWAQYGVRGAVEANFGPVTVPEGGFFVLGDNLAESVDSRTWGPLPRGHVIGKALYIYFSPELNRIGRNL